MRPLRRTDPGPEHWDLGHHDWDRSVYTGPEHRFAKDCAAGGNRATARHRRRKASPRGRAALAVDLIWMYASAEVRKAEPQGFGGRRRADTDDVHRWRPHLVALFLPEAALLVLAIALLFSVHRWLGFVIIAVVVSAYVFGLAVVLAARRDLAKGRLKRPFSR